MIHGRNGTIRKRDFEISFAENLKRLRAGHFMNQMQTDEQLRLPAGQILYGVKVPDFVKQITFVGHGICSVACGVLFEV